MAGQDEANRNAAAYVLGVQAAQNILLRTLYTKWAMEKPDPEAFMVNLIEETIGSMDANGAPVLAPADRALMTEIEHELRSFGENVAMRVAAWSAGRT